VKRACRSQKGPARFCLLTGAELSSAPESATHWYIKNVVVFKNMFLSSSRKERFVFAGRRLEAHAASVGVDVLKVKAIFCFVVQ
jgi:hypothetical protein